MCVHLPGPPSRPSTADGLDDVRKCSRSRSRRGDRSSPHLQIMSRTAGRGRDKIRCLPFGAVLVASFHPTHPHSPSSITALPAANAGTVMHLAGRLCSVHAGPFLINSAVSRIQLLACVVTQWLPRPSLPGKTLAVPRPAILIDDSITLTVEWQKAAFGRAWRGACQDEEQDLGSSCVGRPRPLI
jgi:hypothetical protein